VRHQLNVAAVKVALKVAAALMGSTKVDDRQPLRCSGSDATVHK
jgi:hypothetical protein